MILRFTTLSCAFVVNMTEQLMSFSKKKGSLSSDKRDTPKLMLICMHMDVTVEASFESHLVKTFVIYKQPGSNT